MSLSKDETAAEADMELDFPIEPGPKKNDLHPRIGRVLFSKMRLCFMKPACTLKPFHVKGGKWAPAGMPQ
jgi:hypothetical protein